MARMNEQQEVFTRNLRRLLNEKDMPQYKLAEYLGMSTSAVNKWYIGGGMPRMSKIDEIANVLNVDKAELLDDKPVYPNAVSIGKYKIPVVGNVAAGSPIYADEEVMEYIDYPKNPEGVFGLYVHGDSMTPRIHDGDIVLVDQNAIYADGDIVVATVNGEDGCCKRLKMYKDGISLISLNTAYEPMYYSKQEVNDLPVRIVGRVVEIRSRL